MAQEAHYGFIGPNKHMFESDVSGLLIAALLVNTPRLQLMRQYATILCYLNRKEINGRYPAVCAS